MPITLKVYKKKGWISWGDWLGMEIGFKINFLIKTKNQEKITISEDVLL